MEDYDQNPPLDLNKANKGKKNKITEQKLYILTYNVKTLSTYERLLDLNEALTNIKYDIIGLAETRRFGTKIEEYEQYILCHTGETPGLYGIGFLVNKRLKNNIESYIGLSERVGILNITLKNINISIIQVYAPTERCTEDEIENFYITVNKAIEISHRDYVVMGDLNAKIGKPRQEEHLIMKNNGYGVRNSRGQRLIDFALENNLSIMNTFFKKKLKNKWTWRSPDWKHKNEIDFILSNRPSLFENVDVLNLNYPSDHRPVRATLTFKIPNKSRSKYNHYKTYHLKTEEQIVKFQDTLKSYLMESQLNVSGSATVQEQYDNLSNIIIKSLQSTTDTNTKKNNILSEPTLRLMRRRQELQNTNIKTRAIKNELSALYKLTSKYLKNDYSNHRMKTIEKHLSNTGSTKKAFKELRTYKSWIDALSCKKKTLNSRNDIITTATEFYRTLYSSKQSKENTDENIPYMNENKEANLHHIDPKEVLETINKLKQDKCPGSDKITNEILKIASPIITLPITKLFNYILEQGETPRQWSESNIILLYKKGDPKNITNYRPISLLPCMYKLFSSIINQRLNNTLESKQPVEQAGFRKGYSTIDHIHSLELIIEKYQEKTKPLYIAYIDYQKAFDTISHDSVWETLIKQEVEIEYIKVIQSIYKNNKSRIQLETTGPWFPVRRGVRQGDPLSPRLFIATLEQIISKLDWKKHGLRIEDKYLSHLRFADDLVLLAENGKHLQCMIESLNTVSKDIGLEMNLTKTKIMTNSRKVDITIDQEKLEYTDEYIYLGKQISFNKNNNEKEVERRAQLTWNKYWSLKEIFKGQTPLKLKTKLFNSCILPCLTYGCQTWKYTDKVRNKLVTCQRGIERSMLNLKKLQRIRHTKIRQTTKVKDGLEFALTQKWKWAGHVARLQDQRWTKIITQWEGPLGKRKRGRPKARWEDEIRKITGPNWMEIAQCRDSWNSMEEAFTCRGVPTN